MKEIAVVKKSGSIFRLALSIIMIGFATFFVILFALGQAKNSVGFVITAAVIFILGGIFFLISSIKVLLIKNPIIVFDGESHLQIYPHNEKKKTSIKLLEIVSIDTFVLSNRFGKKGNIGSLDIVTKNGTYELKNILLVEHVKETIEQLKNKILEDLSTKVL